MNYSNIEVLKVKKLQVVISLALLSALIVAALPIIGVKAQETLIWESDVLSNGTPVPSPVLQAGRQYRIVAKGAFASYDPMTGLYNFLGDAQYYTPCTPSYQPSHYYVWDPLQTYPAPNGHSFLQINGMDVNWGPFSNGDVNFGGHEYTVFYFGTGASISFAIVDWIDGNYANNVCHIHIIIYAETTVGGHVVDPTPWETAPYFIAGGLAFAAAISVLTISSHRKTSQRKE